MTIPINWNSKIYIAAPANSSTGGPELLHQLCYSLRTTLNYDAFMHYYPKEIDHPVHLAYASYNNPYVKEIPDEPQNILIVPEVTKGIALLTGFARIRKFIWWLSIDNYFISKMAQGKKTLFLERALNKVYHKLFGKSIFDTNEKIIKSTNFFTEGNTKEFISLLNQLDGDLVQSHYAKDFLSQIGAKKADLEYLSDYLNIDFLKKSAFDNESKKNIVVFNPKKGLAFTRKIIAFSKSKNIAFVPIQKMSREAVINLLKSAKVYIDFGNHPGKDRLPREAAILGCCVITGKRGAAAYFDDVPIAEAYKFLDKEENIPNIVAKIKDCFESYEKRINEFEQYRDFIKKEPEKFIDDLKKIFVRDTQ